MFTTQSCQVTYFKMYVLRLQTLDGFRFCSKFDFEVGHGILNFDFEIFSISMRANHFNLICFEPRLLTKTPFYKGTSK